MPPRPAERKSPVATRKTGILASLRARGFDRSRVVPFERGVHVACSQCEALVINGIACHEHGCPNTPHYCPECGGLDPDRTCCTPAEDTNALPQCAIAMGCLCAAHAMGRDPLGPCSADESCNPNEW